MSEYSSPVGKMLGKIAGTYDGEVPEPSNELEAGLNDILTNGGSGSGGNVLTLYGRYEEMPSGEEEESISDMVAYLDPEYTKKQFDTYEDAYNAVTNASMIKLVAVNDLEKVPIEFMVYAEGYQMSPADQIVCVNFVLPNNDSYAAILFGTIDYGRDEG